MFASVWAFQRRSFGAGEGGGRCVRNVLLGRLFSFVVWALISRIGVGTHVVQYLVYNSTHAHIAVDSPNYPYADCCALVLYGSSVPSGYEDMYMVEA